MKKITIISLLLLICISINVSATNYNSTAGATFWNVAASWISVPGGLPGVPIATDNCTILAGHTVKVNAAGACANLTINGTGKIQYIGSQTIQVNGNYTMSGIEIGNGTMQFNTAGANITVTGTVSATLKYFFNADVNIIGTSIISKLASTTQIAAGKTVTNLGDVTLAGVLNSSTSVWTNGAGAKLTLSQNGFMAGGTFNASAIGNQVTLTYTTGNVPTTSTGFYKLIIGGASGTKSLTQSTTVANDFTINAGNTLDANSNNLFVGGNWTKNGLFTASSGFKVEFNGNSAQTISGTTPTTFTQLTINNTSGGVTISSGTYQLDEVLTISDGNFNTGGNTFTMTSTATKTARIAPVSVTGSISGNFTIERYIYGRIATWADLSSPVQSSTFLDWDNELPAISYAYSTSSPTAYPTQQTFNETANANVPVTSSGTILTPGLGFEVYLAGDYAYNPLLNTTINTVGVPNFGDANLSSLISFNSAGSNLVGNPFASNILWNNVFTASSGIDVNYDIYDNTTASYSTFGLGSEIGSSQGFWVYTTSAVNSLNIPETAKTLTSNSDLKSKIVQPYFNLKLLCLDNNYSQVLKVAADADATDGFDFGKDHPYRKSPTITAPGIYTTIDGKKSVINVFNSSNETYDMPLSIVAGVSGNYKIEASGFDFIGDYTCIRLEDKLFNKTIDLTAELSYFFHQNATDKTDRFVAHFSKTGSCKSLVSNSASNAVQIENEPEVLPSLNGNIINFNNSEITNTTLTVTDILGQKIINDMNVDALNQSININLPESYSGLYIIRIESPKSVITKRFVKK